MRLTPPPASFKKKFLPAIIELICICWHRPHLAEGTTFTHSGGSK